MKLYRHTFQAMASPCEVQIFCADAEQAKAAMDAAQNAVRRIETKYSRYLPASVVSQINKNAGLAPVAVDAETVALLNFADQCFIDSDGMFDISSGILRRAWNFKLGALPAQAQIDALLPLIDWSCVQLENDAIYLPKAGMEIDFGGFGKEYAADMAASEIAKLGHQFALVNLGGDVRVLGPQVDGKPWRVAIQHPRNLGSVIAMIEISAGALASSGDYERFIEVAGKRYCHVLNPKTGWPVYGVQSVSVQAPLCIVAGAHATLAMLSAQSANDYLNQTNLPFLLIKDDGKICGHLLQA